MLVSPQEAESSFEERSKRLVAAERIYVFDKYRLDTRERRLWCEETVIALPPKAFDLLHVLLEQAGQLVSKRTLLETVWHDTVVEEGNLSVYISILRKALSKGSPGVEFIETVTKSGYRFATSVTKHAYPPAPENEEPLSGDFNELVTPQVPATGTHEFVSSESAQSGRLWLSVAVGIIAVLVVTLFVTVMVPRHTTSKVSESKPLIGPPGFYEWPSFSPDGTKLAYAWRGGNEASRNVYVQDVGSDVRLKLTSDGDNFSPAWSSNGDEIAFLHGVDQQVEIEIVKLGTSHEVQRIAAVDSIGSAFHDPPSLSWSSDGLWLVTTEKDDLKGSSSLVLISSDGKTKKVLTSPPDQTVDNNAVFSPDGSQVAFLRARGPSSGLLYVIPVQRGSERLISFPLHSIDGLTWSTDGKSLLVSSARALTVGNLWRVPLNGDAAAPLSSLSAHTADPAVSSRSHRLAYVELLRSVSLWRVATNEPRKSSRLIASDFIDSAPDYSPDGSKIAFESDRSGATEIWVARSDGTDAKRITNIFGPMTGSPRWSPDGTHLAFDSRVKGKSAVFVVGADGGTPTRITTGGFEAYDNVVPSWSHNGRFLYFSSNRTGRYEVWRRSVVGDEESPITTQGGFNGVESADGKSLLYVRNTEDTSISEVPLGGGIGRELVNHLGPGMWGYWSLYRDSLYYLDRTGPGSTPATIYRLNLKTGVKENLGSTQLGINADDKGLSVSPDGQWLVFAQRDVDRTSIMVDDDWP